MTIMVIYVANQQKLLEQNSSSSSSSLSFSFPHKITLRFCSYDEEIAIIIIIVVIMTVVVISSVLWLHYFYTVHCIPLQSSSWSDFVFGPPWKSQEFGQERKEWQRFFFTMHTHMLPFIFIVVSFCSSSIPSFYRRKEETLLTRSF